jgi:tRNA(Ile)-lysidine synthase
MDAIHDPIEPEELDALFARFAALGPSALAVSGGSDSTALMVLYADWLRQRGEDPGRSTVLTVDHGLRPSSAGEARAVAATAAELGFRHATLPWEGPKPASGIQAAARAARYRLMGDHMRAHGLSVLLTGHTRDDQAETLLMRLARGSGLDGLSAMAPVSPLGEREPGSAGRWIVRPFLDVPKACLRATLEARGVRWMEDPSNIAPEFERARLRAAGAQLAALGLTPDMLALSAARLGRSRRAIEAMVGQLCEARAGAVRVDPWGVIAIDRARLRQAGEEVALRLLGCAVTAAGGVREPVPLGKLEQILVAVCSAGAASSRWTLARALITAEKAVVRLEREPGREPLPELTVARGATVLWDGRYWVKVGAGHHSGHVQVRPLGAADARALRRAQSAAEAVPAHAAATVPSLWDEGELVAVPPLGYWTTPQSKRTLEATFAGLGGPGETTPWRAPAADRRR